MSEQEWEDVEILDENTLFEIAKEYVHFAFITKKAGDFRACSSYVTKALNAMNDCEGLCSDRVQVLRQSLELL